ncbi:MAG: DUF1634 domain-containing protein [Methanomassiliicoccales archaeon]
MQEDQYIQDGNIIITFPADEKTKKQIEEEVREIESRNQLDLEATLSYVLLYGVITSLIIIVSGVLLFLAQQKTLNIDELIHTASFAALTYTSFLALFHGHVTPFGLISLGIVVLMLTPYLRVVSSWVYFSAKEKNVKYFFITLWVLILLTVSLFLR